MLPKRSPVRPIALIVALLAVCGGAWFGIRWWQSTQSSPTSNFTPAPQAEVQYLDPTDQSDYDAIATGGSLTGVTPESTWSLPIGADPAQTRYAYDFGNGRLFEFVEQPSATTALVNKDGTPFDGFVFTGVVFSRDGGATWRLAFETPRVSAVDGEPDRYNPVGMFTSGGKLFLDIADDRGAGTLMRFSTADASSWHREACYAFNATKYYASQDDVRNPLDPIRPDALVGITCPDYAE